MQYSDIVACDADVSVVPSRAVDKYTGRSWRAGASHPLRQKAISGTMAAVQTIESMSKRNAEWQCLKDEFMDAAVVISDPERHIQLYKLEIYTEAICPYIASMQTRMSISPDRFPQLRRIIQSLDLTDQLPAGPISHPSAVLLDIERMAEVIDREPSWFRSDLAIKLKSAVSYQWQPIIRPIRQYIVIKALIILFMTNYYYRTDLQNIALKLLFLSLIEIARPLVLAWPLLLVLKEALVLTRALESAPGDRNVIASGLALVKPLMLLFIVYQITGVLALLSGSGYFFALLGAFILLFQSSDAILKPYVPLIAEHLSPLVAFVDTLHQIESKITGSERYQSNSNAPGRTVPTAQRDLLLQLNKQRLSQQCNVTEAPSACHAAEDTATHVLTAMSVLTAMYRPIADYIATTTKDSHDESRNFNQGSLAAHPQVAEVLAEKAIDRSAPQMPVDEQVPPPEIKIGGSKHEQNGTLRRRVNTRN